MLADYLLLVEDLHYAGELHVSWPGNTLDLVLRALVMPSWNSRLRSFMGTVGDSSP
jgi:hypothetical protein